MNTLASKISALTTRVNFLSTKLSNIDSDMLKHVKVESYSLQWSSTKVITLPSSNGILIGSRGAGVANERGFMFGLFAQSDEFLNIKNTANATIAWGGQNTRKLTITLPAGVGSSITAHFIYW